MYSARTNRYHEYTTSLQLVLNGCGGPHHPIHEVLSWALPARVLLPCNTTTRVMLMMSMSKVICQDVGGLPRLYTASVFL